MKKRFSVISNTIDNEQSIKVIRELICALEKTSSDVVCLSSLAEILKPYGFSNIVPTDNEIDLFYRVDCVIVAGGDGSLMHAAVRASENQLPVIGINTGHIGYLAELDPDEASLILRVASGDYTIENRTLLSAKIKGESYECLNDIVLSRSLDTQIASFRVCAQGCSIGSYRCDGLIFATPTGSTAYSLSSGGPVVDPAVDCICFTPVSPHSLLSRPMIFSPDSEFEIINDSKEAAAVYSDGVKVAFLQSGEKVTIMRSDRMAYFVKLKKDSFYNKLKTKLSE